MGLTVARDLNYRAKLWQRGKKAGEVMPEMVRHCDIAVGNEEDADQVFGIKTPDTDVVAGRVEAEIFIDIQDRLILCFFGEKAMPYQMENCSPPKSPHRPPLEALLAAVQLHSIAADHLVAQGCGPVDFPVGKIIDSARLCFN